MKKIYKITYIGDMGDEYLNSVAHILSNSKEEAISVVNDRNSFSDLYEPEILEAIEVSSSEVKPNDLSVKDLYEVNEMLKLGKKI